MRVQQKKKPRYNDSYTLRNGTKPNILGQIIVLCNPQGKLLHNIFLVMSHCSRLNSERDKKEIKHIVHLVVMSKHFPQHSGLKKK